MIKGRTIKNQRNREFLFHLLAIPENLRIFAPEKSGILADTLSPSQRHANMAAIKARDTKPEIIVRRYLWKNGFRYRLNHRRLPGKPDVVLRMYRTCIFVNGCFWHGHYLPAAEVKSERSKVENYHADASAGPVKKCCKIPKTNTGFWLNKIRRNQERDVEVQHKLARMGWHCITIWECELKPERREETLQSLIYTLSRIYLQDHQPRKYRLDEEGPQRLVADGNSPRLNEH